MLGNGLGIFRKAVSLEISNETSGSTARKLRLTQTLCASFFIISSTYWFIFGFFDLKVAQLFVIPIVVNYCIAGVLNKKGWHTTSQFLIIVGTALSLFSFSLLLGKESGAHLIFFALIGLPLILFEPHQKKTIAITTLIPIVLAFLLEITNYSLFIPKTYLSPVIYVYLYPIAIITCAIMIFLAFLFYFRLHYEYEQQLITVNQNLLERNLHNLVLIDQEKILREKAQDSADREHTLLLKTEAQARELEQKLKLERDLIRGGEVQQLILPQTRPESLFIDALYLPARILSGDFWTWHNLSNNKIFVLITDIQGKGVGAAMPTIVFATLLKEFLIRYANKATSLKDIMTYIQTTICKTDAFSSKSAACVAIMIDLSAQTFDYINAGMDDVIWQTHDTVTPLPSHDMPLGFDDEIVTVVTHFYRPGDRIFCGSDGLSDLKSPTGKQFGDKRSKELVKMALQCSDINNVLPIIHDKITSYKKESDQPDDMTLVLIGL